MGVEGIEEVERVLAGVLDQLEERLEAVRVDRGRLWGKLGEHPAGQVSDELRASGEGVVLLAAHLDHPTAFVLKEREEARGSVEVGDAHLMRVGNQMMRKAVR